MSLPPPPAGTNGAPKLTGAAKYSLPIVGAVTLVTALTGGVMAAAVVLLALMGTPLFAIMGGASELAWLYHKDAAYHHLRYIAPTVLDERFADSPILVTIPLFTFLGYVLAESKTPDRLVRAASAAVGWMPGGLAIVCIVASAFFTAITGGSGVTIVAIGGLLYPSLRKQGYSDAFALGLITTGGSLGLLLPPSLPILVYSLVAGIDFNKTFVAGLIPGLMVMVFLAVYSAWVGKREGVKLQKFDFAEFKSSMWELKWEIFIPLIIIGGLVSGVTSIDESAGLAALYTVVVEFFIYKDLNVKKDLPRIAKSSMALAGAVILILAMANALINYVIQESIPGKVLEYMLKLGLTETWQFLIVMNIFLLVLGMLMDGFSAILVAVPLILPFAAKFTLGPFHLAMIFLLNLEIAYCCPPLGLNLFISSFRFNRPVVSLYKVVVPFAGILTFALMLVSYVPWLSDVTTRSDMQKARALAAKLNLPPREAWVLECVQEDRSNPQPCTAADKKAFPGGQMPEPANTGSEKPVETTDTEDEALLKLMGGGGGAADAGAHGSTSGTSEEDELLKQMMGGGTPAPSASAAPTAKPAVDSEEELLKKMMGQ